MATEEGRRAFDDAQRRRLGLLTSRPAGFSDDDLDVLSRAAELMQRVASPTADSGCPK